MQQWPLTRMIHALAAIKCLGLKFMNFPDWAVW